MDPSNGMHAANMFAFPGEEHDTFGDDDLAAISHMLPLPGNNMPQGSGLRQNPSPLPFGSQSSNLPNFSNLPNSGQSQGHYYDHYGGQSRGQPHLGQPQQYSPNAPPSSSFPQHSSQAPLQGHSGAFLNQMPAHQQPYLNRAAHPLYYQQMLQQQHHHQQHGGNSIGPGNQQGSFQMSFPPPLPFQQGPARPAPPGQAQAPPPGYFPPPQNYAYPSSQHPVYAARASQQLFHPQASGHSDPANGTNPMASQDPSGYYPSQMRPQYLHAQEGVPQQSPSVVSAATSTSMASTGEKATKSGRKSKSKKRGGDDSDEEDEEYHGKEVDITAVGQRRSSRLQTRAPIVFPTLAQEAAYSAAIEQSYKEPVESKEGEVKYAEEERDPNAKRFEVEQILQVARMMRSEWESLTKLMNTSKMKDGSRLRVDTSLETSTNNEASTMETSLENKSEPNNGPGTGDATAEDKEEERFLIKWRDASYLHTSWETESDLCTKLVVEYASSRMEPRCRRARIQPPGPYADRGGFNPELKQVDKILDVFTAEDSTELMLLTKWRHLGYDEATWESQSDLNICGVEFAKELERFQQRKEKTLALASTPVAQRQRNLLARDVIPHLAESPQYKNGLRLRSYQLEALNWLTFNWCQHRNSILADEMGLGKTAQAISFANAVAKGRGPILVVAPLATLPHWEREFEAWTDMNVIVFRGNGMSREVCKQREFFVDAKQDWYKFDVLLTNFETVLQEEDALSRCPWALLVVDEAHRLKNRKSKLTLLMRDRMTYSACLLLTGTPIQNDTGELWTLLNFVDREAFPSYDSFIEKYGNIKTAKEMDEFHAVLKPYLLRRFKSDVEATMPPKEEVIIEVELTELQKYYYRSVYEQNVQTLLRGVIPGTRLNLNNVAMQLRKCCNHPYLIEGVEAKALQDHEGAMQSGQVSPELTGLSPQDRVMTLLIQASGKLILLDKLLPKLKQQNHRVLIFSQFVRLLDILEDYLRFRGYGYERIDGSVTATKRQEAIDRYSAPDSTSFVFLLSTRGCGQGINLITADTVVLFDSDWNPQNDVQAQARCHRIGQTKPVSVYRLITRKTYEQEMFTRASLKLGLDEAVASKLQQQASDSGAVGEEEAKLAQGVSDHELEQMLKFGAYALNESADAATTRAFCEADIDEILSTRATKVQARQGSQGASSSLDGPGGSRFSKATFVSKSSGEVDMDDPEFWSKVLGKDIALNEPSEEEFGKGRRRRGPRVIYGEDGVVARVDEEDDEFQLPVGTVGAITRASRLEGRRSRRGERDDDGGAESPTPSEDFDERAGLSMTSTKNLVSGLITCGLGRYAEMRKRVGQHLTEEDCARYALGIVLLCCVFRSKEDRTGELPYPQLETDEDVVNTCKLFAQVVSAESFSVEKYEGPIRKSILNKLKRELQVHEFEVSRSMLGTKRFRLRARETLNLMADVIDVEAFVTADPARPVPLARGVPPAKGWLPADDRAVLASFYKYGFERRRRPDTWKQVFADEELLWTKPWRAGEEYDGDGDDDMDGDGEEEIQTRSRRSLRDSGMSPGVGSTEDDVVVDMRRLVSRYSRIVAALGAAAGRSSVAGGATQTVVIAPSASAQAAAAERARKQQEADEGEVTDAWNDVEKERLNNLLLRWGMPPFSEPSVESIKLSPMILAGGTPPTWDNFTGSLPRKTVAMIKERVENFISGLREMVQAGNCPASRKGLLNRVDLLHRMWTELIPSFDGADDFLTKIGHYFNGVQRQTKFMPPWWLPVHDMALFRAGCRYGLTGWPEALADTNIFPPMPGGGTAEAGEVAEEREEEVASFWSYPSNGDLTRRLVAVIEWLFLVETKILPIDIDLEAAKARGLQLVSPPTIDAMKAQMEDSASKKRAEEQAQAEAKIKLQIKEEAAAERARSKADKLAAKQKASEDAAIAAIERKERKKVERALKRAEARAASGGGGDKPKRKRKRKSKLSDDEEDEDDDDDDFDDFGGLSFIPPPPPPSSGGSRRRRAKIVDTDFTPGVLVPPPPPDLETSSPMGIPPPPPKEKRAKKKNSETATMNEIVMNGGGEGEDEDASAGLMHESDTIIPAPPKRKRGRPKKQSTSQGIEFAEGDEEFVPGPSPSKSARSSTPKRRKAPQQQDYFEEDDDHHGSGFLLSGLAIPPPPPPVLPPLSSSSMSMVGGIPPPPPSVMNVKMDDFVDDALHNGAVGSGQHETGDDLIIF